MSPATGQDVVTFVQEGALMQSANNGAGMSELSGGLLRGTQSAIGTALSSASQRLVQLSNEVRFVHAAQLNQQGKLIVEN